MVLLQSRKIPIVSGSGQQQDVIVCFFQFYIILKACQQCVLTLCVHVAALLLMNHRMWANETESQTDPLTFHEELTADK